MKALLFDYGHTLVDFHRTEEALLRAYASIRETVIQTVAEEEPVPEADRLVQLVAAAVDAVVDASYRERRLEELDLLTVFDEVLRGVGFSLPAEAVRRIVELDHEAYRSSIVLPDETVRVLDELRRRGFRVGFVSNAHFLPELLREDLAGLGLDALVDAGAFSSEVGTRKPDPRIFHHVLRELGAEPSETLMVGDRVGDDLGGARRAGLAGGVLTHQWRQEEPDGTELAVVTVLGQVLDLVDRPG